MQKKKDTVDSFFLQTKTTIDTNEKKAVHKITKIESQKVLPKDS
jgi:hypothetical protein